MAGTLLRRVGFTRGLRTNWLIVGMHSSSKNYNFTLRKTGIRKNHGIISYGFAKLPKNLPCAVAQGNIFQ
jgi:hypothetical protein